MLKSNSEGVIVDFRAHGSLSFKVGVAKDLPPVCGDWRPTSCEGVCQNLRRNKKRGYKERATDERLLPVISLGAYSASEEITLKKHVEYTLTTLRAVPLDSRTLQKRNVFLQLLYLKREYFTVLFDFVVQTHS